MPGHAGVCLYRSTKSTQLDAEETPAIPPSTTGRTDVTCLEQSARHRLDCRLAGLADSVGAKYTRYADDLALSGDRRISNLAPLVGAILLEEGFAPNHRRTRLQRSSQHQRVAGTIVNFLAPNIERSSYDNLKATLHNCAQQGAAGEDRENLGPEGFRLRLLGQIAWVRSLNPRRAAKLQALFDQIDWC